MTQNGAPIPADTLMQAVRPILSDHFKPALLARMTVLPYRSLNPESMKQIVTLKLNKLAKTLRTSNKIELSYSDATIDQIVSRCTEVETGARNIEQILNGSVLPRMAEEILSHMAADGMPASVSLDVDADGAFTMQFEKE
jgi:type VI secretion system protein VasG